MAASKTPPNAKSRVLIADDNPPNVELLEAFLAELDYEICVAVDGHDTLAKVASFQPDLILLDVMMPKLSGFEVCKKLKGDPATRTVMILMVTALNELGDIERAVDSGTDDFLSKPVNKVELIKRVENMLELRHVTDELERLRRYIQRMEDDDAPGAGMPDLNCLRRIRHQTPQFTIPARTATNSCATPSSLLGRDRWPAFGIADQQGQIRQAIDPPRQTVRQGV